MASRLCHALLLGALACGALAAPATGGNIAAVRKQVESSLQLSGTVTIAPDGRVLAHTLDPDAPIGAPVASFIAATVAQWRFEPVQVAGEVVTAKVPMHLRLVARPAADGKMSVSIASTYFGSQDAAATATTDGLRSIKLTPPRYPQGALSVGGKGTVYLIVQVDRQGKVANVDAEQVNLRVLGTEAQMAALRKQFTDAAVRAARGWSFAIPTTGPEAGDSHWLVRVPVDYVLSDDRRGWPQKGGWDTYVPGPRNMSVPWASELLRTAGSPDALPDGGVYPLRQGATLLPPPVT